MKEKKQKIVVGISGGVDSSVAAYLLKKEGYDVYGVFVKTWSPEWLPCTWVDEKRDAMRVCAALDIPFHFLDAEEAYKKGVADYMIAEYRAGRTPNPDVLCNRVIKFGVLWDYAQSLGVEMIATGHYARIDKNGIRKGVDEAKDQSYFLWMIEKEKYAHIRFPIGSFKKNEVRTIAQRAGLFTSEKKDSQGICFLGNVDMREFLSHYIDQKEGVVVLEDGTPVGTHDGVWFYTIGERHGFTVTTSKGNTLPHYVVGKNVDNNELIVSSVSPSVFLPNKTVCILLRDEQWTHEPQKGAHYEAQIRYHGALLPVVVHDRKKVLLSGVEMVPAGQSIVFYDGDRLIGGGIIDSSE